MQNWLVPSDLGLNVVHHNVVISNAANEGSVHLGEADPAIANLLEHCPGDLAQVNSSATQTLSSLTLQQHFAELRTLWAGSVLNSSALLSKKIMVLHT
uniref:Uncharacterized protein n=1 Tax=Sphaerodactylus townsendi TaxID=933632 RepID=A0ACB8FSE8_9SAUR